MSIASTSSARIRCDFCKTEKDLGSVGGCSFPKRDEMSGRMMMSMGSGSKDAAREAGFREWACDYHDVTEYGARSGHACAGCHAKLNAFLNKLGAE